MKPYFNPLLPPMFHPSSVVASRIADEKTSTYRPTPLHIFYLVSYSTYVFFSSIKTYSPLTFSLYKKRQ